MITRPHNLILGVALLSLALGIAQSLAAARSFELPLDGRMARERLSGAHAVEQDGARRFRWTQGDARYAVDLPGAGPLILTFRLGSPPPAGAIDQVGLGLDDTVYASLAPAPTPRTYRLLAPAPLLHGTTVLRVTSRAASVPPDPRPIGVRLEGLALALPRAGPLPPAPALVLSQAGLLALIGLLVYRLRLPLAAQLLAVALAASGLLALSLSMPLITWSYTARLALALALLAIPTAVLLPRAERRARAWGVSEQFVRAAWGLAIVACMIRLAGALFPLFQAHDLALNVERLLRTVSGTLVSTNRSFEFRSGVTVYPPGPYLVMLPGLLLGLVPALLIQAGNALIDGLGALATAALARAAGASERAALLAGLLYTALPVMLTSLYWGHSAQVFGQGLMPPIALALLVGIRRPRSPAFALTGALVAFALLSHIGVSILAIAWLGLAWLALVWRRTLAPADLLRLTAALGLAGLAGLALVYGPALALKIEETSRVGERVASEGYASYGLIWRAFQISFYAIGLILIAPGAILAPRALRLPPGVAELGGAWVVAALIFLGVELATGLQVRYLVFLAPIACILIGLALDRLAARGRIASAAAWALAVAMVLQGCASWYNGTFLDVQMSMVPLLR